MRKPIKNYEGLYEADDNGFIIKVSREQKDKRYGEYTKEVILKPYYTRMKNGSKGYAIVTLSKGNVKDKRTVHSLIYETFVGDYDIKNSCIDHIDDNKENNKLSNLECVTYNENTNRALDKGLMAKEFGRSFCKTTEIQLLKALSEIKNGLNNRQAEISAGIPLGTISMILRYKSFKSFFDRFVEANKVRETLKSIPR